MSCVLQGKDCTTGMDCLKSSSDPTCIDMLCGLSKTCEPTSCNSNNDCATKFGDGFTCVAGQCTSIGCGSSDDCPSGMVCGPDKICTSQTCNGLICDGGRQCKSMGGAGRKCVSNPGIRWRSFIPLLFILIISIILVAALAYKRHSIIEKINK